ncbi:GTPase [Georgenia sp. SYP-B2076]|uniref:GTPase n=1 Tax=Georgenia sp. SYP-B2076 TaxID=2495881 RepID=UPI000F8D001C|nr:GTPase [Georgenia sp. SYP-B2076]
MTLTTTVTATPARHTPHGAALADRAAALTAALDTAGAQVDPFVAARAREGLAGVQARLAVGVDRTVVALVGGTGSGKSSLFNAISGLRFADVGALRPTTDEAAACVWGGNADALLDFLEVSPARRIERESVLDGENERALHGMVLLDLPDHDSIALEHAAEVDRLLPLTDVLVWVVDPQKYADNALHERYLTALRGRQENMLVLVNQVDTIPPAAVERVREDVRALLVADGLDRVEVLATSALEHTGIEAVRERLGRAVARPSVAASTAAAEVDAVCARLAPAVGAAGADATPGEVAVADAAAALARAGGAVALADSLRPSGRGDGPARPEPAAEAAVAALRDGWVARAREGLPARWAAAVDEAVAPAATLRAAVTEAVGAVAVPAARSRRADRQILLAALFAVAGAGWAAVALVQASGWLVVLAPAAVAVAAGAVLLARARAVRRADVAALSADYVEQVTVRCRRVVEEQLVSPVALVLGRHRQLRGALDHR